MLLSGRSDCECDTGSHLVLCRAMLPVAARGEARARLASKQERGSAYWRRERVHARD